MFLIHLSLDGKWKINVQYQNGLTVNPVLPAFPVKVNIDTTTSDEEGLHVDEVDDENLEEQWSEAKSSYESGSDQISEIFEFVVVMK